MMPNDAPRFQTFDFKKKNLRTPRGEATRDPTRETIYLSDIMLVFVGLLLFLPQVPLVWPWESLSRTQAQTYPILLSVVVLSGAG